MISLFPSAQRQRGAAAVELALVLPVFVLLLSFLIFLGRYFWHYTAAQKATQDATLYLSTISAQEMRDPALAPAAAAIAQQIMQMELADLKTGGLRPRVEIQCGGEACLGVTSSPLPETVTAIVRMDMFDHIFGLDFGRYGLRLNVRHDARYVGN